VNCPTIELSMYLDGALSRDRVEVVEDHIRECPSCAARVKEERKLRRGLLVLACPSAEVLGRYFDGSLRENAVVDVRGHVDRCSECSSVLEWTREAAATLESGELPKATSRPHHSPL
jgi:anti-sigma factor RsiW